MFVRTSVSLALVTLVSTLGCAVQPAGTGEDSREGPAGQTSEAMSYQPMGFARVTAAGGITTQFADPAVYPPVAGAVTAAHLGAGHYSVSFGSVGGAGGHAQVTAEGAGNERCRVLRWSPSGTTENVEVQCNRPDGTAADTAFAAVYFHYVQPTTTSNYASMAYLWSTSGTVLPAWSYNGSGHANSVVHNGVGVYTATLPKVGAYNASVMVTAYGGTGAPFCTVSGWSANVDATVVVRCWNTAGAAADSDFALSYSTSGPTLDQQGGHAYFVGSATSAPYSSAMGRIEYCSPAAISGSRAGNVASIVLTGDLGTWDANPFRRASFVSAYGASATYCKVASLSSVITSASSSTSTTTARCFNAAGTEIAPTFTFTQITSDAAGPC